MDFNNPSAMTIVGNKLMEFIFKQPPSFYLSHVLAAAFQPIACLSQPYMDYQKFFWMSDALGYDSSTFIFDRIMPLYDYLKVPQQGSKKLKLVPLDKKTQKHMGVQLDKHNVVKTSAV